MTALASERERVAIAVVFRDHPACIEIVGYQPLIDDRQLDDTCGLGEGLLGRARIADFRFESEIVRPVRPDFRARRA